MPYDNSLISVIKTVTGFIAHWKIVNREIAPQTPITLSNGYDVADFEADVALFVQCTHKVQGANLPFNKAVHSRDLWKKAALSFLATFRHNVIALMPHSQYAKRLPVLPKPTLSESKFLAPLFAADTLWGEVDAAPPPGVATPFVLLNGATRADLQELLRNLQAAYRAVEVARTVGGVLRTRRDEQIPDIRVRMVEYRRMVLARFGADSAYTKSLPRYSPIRHKRGESGAD